MLKFDIDRDRDEKLYILVYERIKRAIEEGELKRDSRLPSIRSAAAMLGVNPTTIVKAYDLLERDGYLYKIVGSGSYVGEIKSVVESSSEETEAMEELWYRNEDDRGRINFAGATPSPELFPVEEFKRAVNIVLDREGGEAFSYEDSKGYRPLRRKVAEILSESEIDTCEENIQIVSGSQQAIDIAGRMLIKPGDKVVVEEPTYPGAISSFKRAGAHIITIPMERDGMNLKKLKHVIEKEGRISFIYTITNFQNPTGVSWSEVKKKQLLKMTEEKGIIIVEDDCMSEIYFGKTKPRSLKSYDGGSRVIYIKSFSKIFMPGLRFAFMILPDDLKERATKIKYMADISTSGLTQRTFYEYLNTGGSEKHLQDVRKIFKKRHDLMKRELEGISQIRIPYKNHGGLSFWIELPQWMDGEKFSRIAYDRGLVVFSGQKFFLKKISNSYVRVSYAGVDSEEIKRGMEIFRECLRVY